MNGVVPESPHLRQNFLPWPAQGAGGKELGQGCWSPGCSGAHGHCRAALSFNELINHTAIMRPSLRQVFVQFCVFLSPGWPLSQELPLQCPGTTVATGALKWSSDIFQAP